MWNIEFNASLTAVQIISKDTTTRETRNFITRVEELLVSFFETRFNPDANNQSFAKLIRSKLSNDLMDEAGQLGIEESRKMLSDWSTMQFWLLTRKNLHQSSRSARTKLQNFTQGSKTIEQTFEAMLTINEDVDHYSLKGDDFNLNFCRALNSPVRAKLTLTLKNQESENHEHYAETGITKQVKHRWLLERAVNIVESESVAPRSSNISSYTLDNNEAAAPVKNPPQVPSAFQLRGPDGQKQPLTDEGREFFNKNYGCRWCRELGHKSTKCADLARFKAADNLKRVARVRTSLRPANSSGVKPGLGDEGSVALLTSKKIKQNEIEPHSSSPVKEAVLQPDPSIENTEPKLHLRAATGVFQVENVEIEPSIQLVADNSILLDRIDDSRPSGVPIQPQKLKNFDDTPMKKWATSTDRFLFNGEIMTKQYRIEAKFLLDTGSDGNVINESFALLHKLPVTICESRKVKVANNEILIVNKECTFEMKIGSFFKHVTFSVGQISEDVILGVPFLQSITILNSDWRNHRFQFVSRSGTRHMWYGVGHSLRSNNEKPMYLCSFKDIQNRTRNSELFSINVLDPRFKQDLCSITSTQQHNEREPKQEIETFLSNLKPDLVELLRPYLESTLSEPPNYKDIPARPEDQKIELKPGVTVRHRPLRRFSPAEDKLLQEKLTDLLERGFIQPSSSSFGANVIFARKSDGGWRFCVDYRELNSATVKDRTPLPSHTELRQRVQGAKFMSKVDVRDAFHMIRLHEPDCHKTAFKTRFGLFEYTVSPFGTTNSPATFMRLMNRIFFDLTDRCVIYYVDDVLIYSETYEQHLLDIQTVFDRLAANKLHVKLTKCIFAVQSLDFCGMIVSVDGFSIQDSAIDSMCNYPDKDPKTSTAKYVQKFMGSIRWFADFIPFLAELASPLFELTKDDNVETWNINHQSVQRAIQFHLTRAPVLGFFDPTNPLTFTTTDASDHAIGGWLGQLDKEQKTRVVSYWSRKLVPSELNYPVHDRELLALVEFIKKFRIYLHGLPFTAYVDHKSLALIQTQPHLSARQVRWIQFLQEFEFSIKYVEGEENSFADWLSRRPDYSHIECPKCKFVLNNKGGSINSIRVADPDYESHDSGSRCSILSLDLVDIIRDQTADPFCIELNSWLLNPKSIPATKTGYAKSFSRNNNGVLMYRKTATVIPKGPLQLQHLEFFHDRLDRGHFGFPKTFASMQSRVYWPNMNDDITKFIASCDKCQRSKSHNDMNHGLLHPLPIPDERFQSINIDFASMPRSDAGKNSMMVICDRLTKMGELIATNDKLTAAGCAELLYLHWFLSGKGYPDSIISDRDPKFTSDVWRLFCQKCGIKRVMSTARHQQTDGGAEALIKTVKTMLKGIVNHKQTNWDTKLPALQFAYNSSKHSSTGFPPFYLANAYKHSSFPKTAGDDSKLLQNFMKHADDLDTAYSNIQKSQDRMSSDYNKRRTESPEISIGDKVLLKRDGIAWPPESEVSAKLRQPYLGPFEVTFVDSEHDNITLKLPVSMRIHPTFHIKHIRQWISPQYHFPARHALTSTLPPDVTEDSILILEVHRILDKRTKSGHIQYLVSWKGFDKSFDSWEPVEYLSCNDLLDTYEKTAGATRKKHRSLKSDNESKFPNPKAGLRRNPARGNVAITSLASTATTHRLGVRMAAGLISDVRIYGELRSARKAS
jgi:hypothetical protein